MQDRYISVGKAKREIAIHVAAAKQAGKAEAMEMLKLAAQFNGALHQKAKPAKKRKQRWISNKIARIEREGIKGKKPAPGQAAAVAYSMWRRRTQKAAPGSPLRALRKAAQDPENARAHLEGQDMGKVRMAAFKLSRVASGASKRAGALQELAKYNLSQAKSALKAPPEKGHSAHLLAFANHTAAAKQHAEMEHIEASAAHEVAAQAHFALYRHSGRDILPTTGETHHGDVSLKHLSSHKQPDETIRHKYEVHVPDAPALHLHFTEHPDKSATVDWFGDKWKRQYNPGAANMLKLHRALRQLHPGIQRIRAQRIGGARAGLMPEQQHTDIRVPIHRKAKPTHWQPRRKWVDGETKRLMGMGHDPNDARALAEHMWERKIANETRTGYKKAIDPDNHTFSQLFEDRKHSGNSGHLYETDRATGFQKQGREYHLSDALLHKVKSSAPKGSDYSVHLIRPTGGSEYHYLVAKHSRKDRSVTHHAILTHQEMHGFADREMKRNKKAGFIARAFQRAKDYIAKNKLTVKARPDKLLYEHVQCLGSTKHRNFIKAVNEATHRAVLASRSALKFHRMMRPTTYGKLKDSIKQTWKASKKDHLALAKLHEEFAEGEDYTAKLHARAAKYHKEAAGTYVKAEDTSHEANFLRFQHHTNLSKAHATMTRDSSVASTVRELAAKLATHHAHKASSIAATIPAKMYADLLHKQTKARIGKTLDAMDSQYMHLLKRNTEGAYNAYVELDKKLRVPSDTEQLKRYHAHMKNFQHIDDSQLLKQTDPEDVHPEAKRVLDAIEHDKQTYRNMALKEMQILGKRLAKARVKKRMLVTAEIQRAAEANEIKVRDALGGGETFNTSHPVDIHLNNHGLEVKTLFTRNKLNMLPAARQRKLAWAQQNKATLHTVAFHEGRVLYRRGVGAFRTMHMHETSLDKLHELVHMKDSDLPEKAREKQTRNMKAFYAGHDKFSADSGKLMHDVFADEGKDPGEEVTHQAMNYTRGLGIHQTEYVQPGNREERLAAEKHDTAIMHVLNTDRYLDSANHEHLSVKHKLIANAHEHLAKVAPESYREGHIEAAKMHNTASAVHEHIASYITPQEQGLKMSQFAYDADNDDVRGHAEQAIKYAEHGRHALAAVSHTLAHNAYIEQGFPENKYASRHFRAAQYHLQQIDRERNMKAFQLPGYQVNAGAGKVLHDIASDENLDSGELAYEQALHATYGAERANQHEASNLRAQRYAEAGQHAKAADWHSRFADVLSSRGDTAGEALHREAAQMHSTAHEVQMHREAHAIPQTKRHAGMILSHKAQHATDTEFGSQGEHMSDENDVFAREATDAAKAGDHQKAGMAHLASAYAHRPIVGTEGRAYKAHQRAAEHHLGHKSSYDDQAKAYDHMMESE